MPDVWSTHPHAIRQSPDELGTWAPSLRIFRYCRAFGGHNNDGDQLLVGLRVDSSDEVAYVLAELALLLPEVLPRRALVTG